MEQMNLQALPHREIEVVTAEIKELKRAAQATAVAYVIEIGRRLKEAKGFLQHGEWSAWLQEEVEFSQSTAINFMKIYEEYGSQQMTLFGAVANSQLIGNLSYTKALKLISIPADERESFAEKVDAENISVKELDAAIKEKKEAEQKAAALEEKVAAMEEAAEREREAVKEKDEALQAVYDLQKQLEEERAKVAKEKEKTKAALKNPKLPPEELKKIKEAAAAEAVSETEKNLEKKIAAATARAEKAEQEAARATRFAEKASSELAEMEKRVKTSSPTVAAFKTMFDVTQENAKKLKEMLSKIRSEDPELAEKLSNAMEALAALIKGE